MMKFTQTIQLLQAKGTKYDLNFMRTDTLTHFNYFLT